MDQGRIEEALVNAELEPDDFWKTWAEAIIYHASGNVANSDNALEKLVRENADGNAYQIGEICSMRGETDEAFAWLERAVNERDPGLTHAKVNPRFRPLHDDPRWPDLLSKVGF